MGAAPSAPAGASSAAGAAGITTSSTAAGSSSTPSVAFNDAGAAPGLAVPAGHPSLSFFGHGAAGGAGAAACPVVGKGGSKDGNAPLSPSAAVWAKAAAQAAVANSGVAAASDSAPAAGSRSSDARAGTGGGSMNAAASACPVVGEPAKEGGRKDRGPVYNVYAQVIDPTNNMPATANQQPAPGQRAALSTTRVQSTIPKGGTDSTWLYPSPQMFWNALVRKEKADGVQEQEIDMVVAIHNEMNERTWKQLQSWEGLHAGYVNIAAPCGAGWRRLVGSSHTCGIFSLFYPSFHN